jgi:serine/threonine-protein kinase
MSSKPSAPPPPPSVLEAIGRATGAPAPRIQLRESPAEHVGTPVMKSGPAVQGLVPQGRGNYQIQGEIARGGMGVILKGHDADLGRDVALKVLREDLAKRPDVVERFVEEAQIGGQLQHPGIVPVYELGLMADQRPYFAMKLVKGRTLAELLLEREAADRRRLLVVFESVCQTMAYAHSKGVVHRDLKPANVLIGAFGEVQVVDWGLAKVIRRGGVADEARAHAARAAPATIIETVRSAPGSVGSESLAGSVMGTPAYMPPEQARGEVEKLDERSDVFSLGAILCEVLTGAPPYAGEKEKVIDDAAHARVEDAIARLRACGADRELVELALDCLTPAPAARPRSAEVLAERMHRHLASVEERARASEIRAAEAKVRARATLLLSLAGIALLLLGGGGWYFVESSRRQRQAQTESGVNDALAAAAHARGQARFADATAAIEQANALLEAGQPTEELRRRVREQSAGIAQESAESSRRADLERQNQELLAHARRLSMPGVGPAELASIDEALFDAFSAFGLELDALPIDEAAAALVDRGIGVPAAAILDRWAFVRRWLERDEDADHLLRVAEAADPDPTRRKLRAAIRIGDRALLKEFQRREDLARIPTASLCVLALGLEEAKDPEAALDVLRIARARDPGDFDVHVMISAILRDNDWSTDWVRFEEIVQSDLAALTLEPDHARLLVMMGSNLVHPLGDPKRGLAMLARAVELAPRDGWIRRRHAQVLAEIGETERALEEARTAARLDPRSGPARSMVGHCLLLQGSVEEAVAELRASLEIDPTNSYCAADLIDALLELGQVAEATRVREESRRRGSRLIYVVYDAAYLRHAAQDREGARAEIEKSIAVTNDKDLESMIEMSFCLAEFPDATLRDPGRATAAARRAIELAPRSFRAWDALGTALYRAGDFAGSSDAFERSMKWSAGGTPAQWLGLAMASHQLGRPVRAQELFREAVEFLEKRSCRDPWLVDKRREAAQLLGIEESGR